MNSGALSGALLLVSLALAAEPRTEEVLRLECRSELGRSDVTLFGNGTVRSRRWDEHGELAMQLAELAPEELEATIRRLAEEDLRETGSERGGAAGPWVESCALRLDLGEGPPRDFVFGALDVLPLALSRLVGAAEDLRALTEIRRAVETLPADYEPRDGDVLLRQDGVRYQVQGLTSDGKAVELLGLDQPFTIYVALESLHGEFRRLVQRP